MNKENMSKISSENYDFYHFNESIGERDIGARRYNLYIVDRVKYRNNKKDVVSVEK